MEGVFFLLLYRYVDCLPDTALGLVDFDASREPFYRLLIFRTAHVSRNLRIRLRLYRLFRMVSRLVPSPCRKSAAVAPLPASKSGPIPTSGHLSLSLDDHRSSSALSVCSANARSPCAVDSPLRTVLDQLSYLVERLYRIQSLPPDGRAATFCDTSPCASAAHRSRRCRRLI